ncbi:hypothetical protein MAHJHV28_45940 [Mycobacterium avium subsp. hominissuis]
MAAITASSTCAVQMLLVVMAAMYASYHGAEGLTAIASACPCTRRAIAVSPSAPW